MRGEIHTEQHRKLLGAAETRTAFWSLLERGIIGTYHNVSKKYLPLYLAEFQLRHNNRNNPDIFGEAIAGA